MATLNNVSTTALTGQNLVYSNGSLNWDTTISINSDMTDFFELVLAALGYDITYNDFKDMPTDQRKQLIRDIKLKTIL